MNAVELHRAPASLCLMELVYVRPEASSDGFAAGPEIDLVLFRFSSNKVAWEKATWTPPGVPVL